MKALKDLRFVRSHFNPLSAFILSINIPLHEVWSWQLLRSHTDSQPFVHVLIDKGTNIMNNIQLLHLLLAFVSMVSVFRNVNGFHAHKLIRWNSIQSSRLLCTSNLNSAQSVTAKKKVIFLGKFHTTKSESSKGLISLYEIPRSLPLLIQCW